MARTDFTITAEEQQLHPDRPDTAVIHDLAGADGSLLAVGMRDTECLEALSARGHADQSVLIRKGALGRTVDETTTIGAIAGG